VNGPVLVVDRNPACLAAAEVGEEPEVEIVEADWQAFLRGWLPAAPADAHLIPAPLAPHLLWHWLAESTGMVEADAPGGWALPFEMGGSQGERFLSAAGWLCPSSCVEPRHCPVLHGARDWDLAQLIEERAGELGYQPATLALQHLALGVFSIPVSRLQEAANRLRANPNEPALVATSSHCHAAIGALERPRPPVARPREVG